MKRRFWRFFDPARLSWPNSSAKDAQKFSEESNEYSSSSYCSSNRSGFGPDSGYFNSTGATTAILHRCYLPYHFWIEQLIALGIVIRRWQLGLPDILINRRKLRWHTSKRNRARRKLPKLSVRRAAFVQAIPVLECYENLRWAGCRLTERSTISRLPDKRPD